MKYKVGDKVRIVDKRTGGMEPCGGMDHWLGKVMTIQCVIAGDYYRMVEDRAENGGAGWYWRDSMIAGLAEEEERKVNFCFLGRNKEGAFYFYDAIKKKEVEIKPKEVVIILEKDSDGAAYIKTVVRSVWDFEDDVVVYFGHNKDTAFRMRAVTNDYIRSKEIDE